MKYLLIASAFLLAACGSAENEVSGETGKMESENGAEAYAESSATLPPFQMVDVQGNTVNLSQFKGKKVFINVWATWCRPCRMEIPSIEKLYEKADKSKAAFVLLSVDNNFDVAKKYAAENDMKVPIYYPAENLPAILQTQGIPATFIFDEKGNLTKRMVGMDDYHTASYINMFK